MNQALLQGVWLPLVTPFREGQVDIGSLRRLVGHYVKEPIEGFILAATTGEGLTLDEDEVERIVLETAGELSRTTRRLPLYLGLSGSDTRKVVRALQRTATWPVGGYLIACPYYTRPSQQGLFHHFSALADSTERPIIIYNIPYRTGVNLGNDTLLQLAARPNFVGVKDCSADAAQSFDLVRRRPPGFAVLTGEDALFYGALAHGADGGILASAHIETKAFVAIHDRLREGNWSAALSDWQRLCDLPRLLFAEPSPAAIKYWLWRVGLIDSPELRLPMMPVSDELAVRIDRQIQEKQPPRTISVVHEPVSITPASQTAVLDLNNTNATALSWLDGPRLSTLIEAAFYARRLGSVDAFLLAFDEKADYDSPNYVWFRDRYPHFIYVDRVAVIEPSRRRGLAQRLYDDLIREADAAGHTIIGCEVNVEPPNPVSDAFHEKLRFVEVGRASVRDGGKTVRYLLRHSTAVRAREAQP